MPEDLQAPPTPPQPLPPAPLPASRPALTGWRKVLVIIGAVAVVLRILLAVLSFSHHGSHANSIGPAVLPAWPPKAGDVFTLKPGDPLIAKWAESPDNDGFLVQLIEQGGKPVDVTKVCALEPDYMADAAQPGGTLTLISQDGTGDWRVHWVGGDTMPPLETSTHAEGIPQADANCGKDAIFTMSQAQLHAWHDMQAGIVVPLAKSTSGGAPSDSPSPSSAPDTPPATPPGDTTDTH